MRGPWDWEDNQQEEQEREGDWWNRPDYDPAMDDPEMNNIDYVDDNPDLF